jgi:hypothetical protein
MEPLDSTLANAETTVVCENCKAEHNSSRKFCPDCSFPIQGSDEEKIRFRLILSSRKRLLSDAQDKIKSAKMMIYVAAAVFFISGLVMYFINNDLPTLLVNLVVSLVYLILAAWSQKNAFGAILTAFIIYATIQIVNAFMDPATILSGIIIKILLIAAFVKGIRSAMEAKGYMKELEKFKAAPVGDN